MLAWALLALAGALVDRAVAAEPGHSWVRGGGDGAVVPSAAEQARLAYERNRAAAHRRLGDSEGGATITGQTGAESSCPVTTVSATHVLDRLSGRSLPASTLASPSHLGSPTGGGAVGRIGRLAAGGSALASRSPASFAGEVRYDSPRQHLVPLLIRGGRAEQRGFVRIVNREKAAGEVVVEAFDDGGSRFGSFVLPVQGLTATHISAADLENGNFAKGLATGFGLAEGHWRLRLTSALNIDVHTFGRSEEGLLVNLQETVVANDGVFRVDMFNGFDDSEVVSRLRLINPSQTDVVVTIRGQDDLGESPGSAVRVEVPAGAARTYSAYELEFGAGVAGALGDGFGKWRLTFTADGPIHAMHLLESPRGELTNLSEQPEVEPRRIYEHPQMSSGQPSALEDALPAIATHRIPLFPAATSPMRSDGLLRVINRSERAGIVTIEAFDQSDKHREPVEIALPANGVVHLSSVDLQAGDAEKGLSRGFGDANGDWRLLLRSALDIRVLAFQRAVGPRSIGDAETQLASLFGTTPDTGYHEIALFGPPGEALASTLRLVNWSAEDAAVAIAAVDDRGQPAASDVRFVLPGHTARSLSAAEMASGDGGGLHGGLGNTDSAWRLTVVSDAPIDALNLQTGANGVAGYLPQTANNADEETATDYFGQHISRIVQTQCVNCHVAGGASGYTRLVFVRATSADHEAQNLQTFTDFLAEAESGAELILAKIRGVGHGGGVQVGAGTEDYTRFERFLELLASESAPPAVTEATLFDTVTLETAQRTLRRAALIFAGRVPTAAEYASLATSANGDAALRTAIRSLMTGSAFHDFLIRASNDQLLTDRELARYAVIENEGYFVDFDNEYFRLRQADDSGHQAWHQEVQYGVGRAPLELIAQVVENDLPYTHILTADYIMANAAVASVYGAETAFGATPNVHDFRPASIERYFRKGPGYEDEVVAGVGLRVLNPGALITDYPHAGLLNTTVFLKRYPTTATNRNRARARWTYYHFLGEDIENSASRTTDPVALADTDNPTFHNSACTVCHAVLDPVAGAFQNYGDAGLYRDQWGGLDSLDAFYKRGADYAKAIEGESQTSSSTPRWPLRLPAGRSKVGLTYVNDFYEEETRSTGIVFLDRLRILGQGDIEMARYEFESIPLPRSPNGLCGARGRNSATAERDHVRIWGGGYPCAFHLDVQVPGAGAYTAEVVAWAQKHRRHGEDETARISVVADPYHEGDTWYRDMREPGFNGMAPPESKKSLPWLAERIVGDERFATASVRFWWPAVMGREIAEPPQVPSEQDYEARLLAAAAQHSELRRLAAGFRRGFNDRAAYNLKDLLVEMALSNWFRAESVADEDPLRKVALRDAGARRLLTPEELSAKTAALTGFEWGRWQHPARKPHRRNSSALTAHNGYRLLYGGIDSDGITSRAREMTSVMAGVAQVHATRSSCPIVLRELTLLPAKDRRLFAGVEAYTSPVTAMAGQFELTTASTRFSTAGHLTAGAKTVFLKFPNDFTNANGEGDRNVRLDRLDLRDGNGEVLQTIELETLAAQECNKPDGDHYALFCAGWVQTTIDIAQDGDYSIDVLAWADQHGDEAARLQIVVEAEDATPAGTDAIKRQLVALHERLLDARLTTTDAEINNAYALFLEVWQRHRATGRVLRDTTCDWNSDIRFLDGFLANAVGEGRDEDGGHRYKHWRWSAVNAFWGGKDLADPHYATRTWAVVLAYLMTDYRYLYL